MWHIKKLTLNPSMIFVEKKIVQTIKLTKKKLKKLTQNRVPLLHFVFLYWYNAVLPFLFVFAFSCFVGCIFSLF